MRHLVTLVALGALLAVAACTPSTTTSPTGNPTTVGPAATGVPAATPGPVATTAATSGAAGTPIQVRDFALDPSGLSVTAGTVALSVTNAGPTVHDVTIRDGAGEVLFGTETLREGESETTTGNLDPGEYIIFCSLPGHESLGIKGTLTVTAP